VDRLVPALAADARWHLAVVGGGTGPHLTQHEEAADVAGVRDRLHILPSVPSRTLPQYLATADVGVHPMERTCLNHELALPNKLFDYLFAGLPLAVSDLREMRQLVDREALGTVFDPAQPDEVAAAILAAARHGHGWAPDRDLLCRLAWEAQQETLLEVYGLL
jgi:glycosyltransferase involved in cell wall biosynthesis